MERERSIQVLEQLARSEGKKSDFSELIPPWLFQHEDLMKALNGAKKIHKEEIINTINYIHFTEGYAYAHLRHLPYNESVIVKVYPGPCSGSSLQCSWSEDQSGGLDPKTYEFLHLILDNGHKMILVPAVMDESGDQGFSLRVEDKGFCIGQRRAKRYPCQRVLAEVIQSGFHAKGELLNFSPLGLAVKVKPEPHCSFHWFNPGEVVNLQLRDSQQSLFSGQCSCTAQRGRTQARVLVLTPRGEKVRRYEQRNVRNPRQRLNPSPFLSFVHPFLGKRIERQVYDLSTSGFSVYEKAEDAVLVPGMIIPELTVSLGDIFTLRCKAQVIYTHMEKPGEMKCGLAILDMGIDDYSRLAHLITNAMDPYAHVSSRVDMDSLWEFFFKTGFIYPKKYGLIQSHRETFKATYERLYQDNPTIARHFTCQMHGKVYGHISMVRAYEKAWMIHHHAGTTMDGKRGGFIVLKQIMHFLNDAHRFPSAHMNYVLSYFRPENRFPNEVFGGFARALNNPKGCSLDLLCYLPYTGLSLDMRLPEGWTLTQSSSLDLWELARAYDHYSGGLLMEAFNLNEAGGQTESLEDIYQKAGFFRKRTTYSLRQHDELQAVFIVDQSDVGLNLSELLNGIKVIVTSPDNLPWNVLSIAIAQLTRVYRMEKVPVLFSPAHYVEAKGLPFEKHYFLWILDVSCGNEYMEFMQDRFRVGYKPMPRGEGQGAPSTP